jgi:excisionase family DNA binding protein
MAAKNGKTPEAPARRRMGTAAAAAEQVPCSEKTIRRYIAAGRLHGYRVGPRMIRVDLDELDELLRPLAG